MTVAWFNVVVLLHVLVALVIIGLVLLQHGKGADMGSGFGGGSSGSLFGATGSANFLSRATAVLATVFFLSSLGLTWFAAQRPAEGPGVLDRVPVQQQKADPKTEPQLEKPAPAQPEKTVPQ
jgi:preprotein translocase subunit SecG